VGEQDTFGWIKPDAVWRAVCVLICIALCACIFDCAVFALSPY
jgi:hypothetical protein